LTTSWRLRKITTLISLCPPGEKVGVRGNRRTSQGYSSGHRIKEEEMAVFVAGIFLGGVIGMIFLSMCVIAKSSDRNHGKMFTVERRGDPVMKRPE